MRINDVLYYAPNVKLAFLLTAKPAEIVDIFKRRIDGYYLDAADILNKNKKAFGAGDLCFDAIDAIARYQISSGRVGDRFKKWISRLPDFDKLTWEELERVYDEFRNGITHEARVKNGGQFTYDIDKAVKILEGIVLINPDLLLKYISHEFNKEIVSINNDPAEGERISQWIREDLREDVRSAHLEGLID